MTNKSLLVAGVVLVVTSVPLLTSEIPLHFLFPPTPLATYPVNTRNAYFPNSSPGLFDERS